MQISGATTGSVVEKMLGKLDQSPSPEMDRELYKETAATGFIGTLFFWSLSK